MAKITSADCIAYAMANLPEVADCPRKNWKRREKFKVGEETIRIFDTWKLPSTKTRESTTLLVDIETKAKSLVTETVPNDQNETFQITVVERGGVIVKATPQVYWPKGPTGGAKVPRGVFIFATSDMSSENYADYIEMDPHYQVVTIGTVKVWKEEGHCTDQYSEREYMLLEPVCKELELDEDMEATYSTKKFATQAALKAALEAAGISHDKGFQKFLDRVNCGEEE